MEPIGKGTISSPRTVRRTQLQKAIDAVLLAIDEDIDIRELAIQQLIVCQFCLTLFDKLVGDDIDMSVQQIDLRIREALTGLVISAEQIESRKAALLGDDDWTDATQSVADGEDDDILVVDDDIMQAMDESDEDEEGQTQGQGRSDDLKDQHSVRDKQKHKAVQEKQGDNSRDISQSRSNSGNLSDSDNLEDIITNLQQQFVTGQPSDHHYLLGRHSKFCVSTCGTSDGQVLFSGGGDDILHLYKRDDIALGSQTAAYHSVRHTETVSRIQVSHDDRYVFSLSSQELLYTNLQSLETGQVPIEQPSAFVCHHAGGVIAAASQFNVDIYNIKGMQLYGSYCLDTEVNSLRFATSGKQIIAVCGQRIRVITPKTNEVIKIIDSSHKPAEITTLATNNDLVLSGCEDGKINLASLSRGAVVASCEVANSVNNLSFAENYFMAGPLESYVDWFDTNKLKRLFRSPLSSSSTDIVAIDNCLYAISCINGDIFLYDRRNPIKQTHRLRAGNTVHELAVTVGLLYAACEDGAVRLYDIKLQK